MTQAEFIRELMAAAAESGIMDAEVYLHQEESMRALVNMGEIEEYAIHSAGGLSLRGLVDGKMGMAYTEAMDRDAIVMLIRGVLESGTLISDTDEEFIYEGSDAYETVDSLGEKGTTEAQRAFALALDAHGRSIDPRVTQLGFTFLQTERETVRIVNSHGLDLSHAADICVGYVSAIAREGERVASDGAMAAAASLADLSAEAIAREAVEETVFQLDASPCDSGVMPVIIRNGAMADLLGAFVGMFSAEAAQKGTSLLAGKEGEVIAAPCVTLTDDPLLPGGFFSRGFDAEGVATYTKNVVENGVLKTLLHNLKSAKKAGVRSTGNAARGGYAGPVGIAPSNFFFQPGDKDLAALEAEMGDGLVITGMEGLHAGTNAVSGDFSLLSRGYLVRGGKRVQAVEQVTAAGNIYQLLKDIVAVGNDMRVELGHVRSPSVWVREISIAGK